MHTGVGSIVVGIDGSESSDRALHWAMSQATAEHRPLTLVHTIHAFTPAFTDAAIADAGDAFADLEAEGRRTLAEAREVVESTAPDLEVREMFALADPREVLLQLSEHAELVVVGSRGRGPLTSPILGSVSVAVARHASCPVVVIRPGNPGEVRKGVAVGIDALEPSRPVLEFAYRQASLHGLPLTVVHCMHDIMAASMGAYMVPPESVDVQQEWVALSTAISGMAEKYPDVHVTSRVDKGFAKDGLVALGEHMDLLVLGTHHGSVPRRALYGSVSIGVVERSHCPVAVVPLVEKSAAHVD